MGYAKPFEKDMYFEEAVQLKLYAFNNEGIEYQVFGAIGWGDVVICMCCGSVFSTRYLAEGEYMYEILPWTNLSKEVLGGLIL